MTKLVSDASPFPITCIGVQLRHLMEMAKSYKKYGKYYHYTFKTFMSMQRVTYILNVWHGNLQGDAADRLWLQPGIVIAIYYT